MNKTTKDSKGQMREFRRDWQMMYREVMKSKKVDLDPAHKKSIFHESQGGRLRVPPAGAITVEQARFLMPPSASIWEARSGGWQSHLSKPYHDRDSKNWIDTGYSHRSACMYVVRAAWVHCVEFDGIGMLTRRCPHNLEVTRAPRRPSRDQMP